MRIQLGCRDRGMAQKLLYSTDIGPALDKMCSTRMPERMQALAQRMKNITPTVTEYPTILVLAENNIQLNEMLTIKSRIRATLAKELHNGQIEVDIRLAKFEEIKPMLTPRESLNKLLETNHPVKELIDALDLYLD